MKYKLAIFDMDGTILDTLEDLKNSTNYVLKKYSFKERSLDEIRRFVGNGLRVLIEKAVPENSGEKVVDELLSDFKEHYEVHKQDFTKPYDGIRDLLAELKKNDIKLAVVSNKPDAAVKILCDQYFNGLFDYSLGEKENIKRKPAPDMAELAVKTLGFSKEECIFIGDSDIDIQTAKNAGLEVIAVLWGFRTKEDLVKEGATVFAAAPKDILDIIYAGN